MISEAVKEATVGKGNGKNQGPPLLQHVVNEGSARKPLHPNLRTEIMLDVGLKNMIMETFLGGPDQLLCSCF